MERQTGEAERTFWFIRLRLLGDIVFTIPAMEIFRDHFPDAHVAYVVEEKFAEIARLIPGIDEVITVSRKMPLSEILAFRKKAKEAEVGTVIDFHSGPKSALLTWITGAKVRAGYRTPNRNWAYNRMIHRKAGACLPHSVVNQVRLLELIGIPISRVPPLPEIQVDEAKLSPPVLEARSVRPKIVLHIGAGNRFRDWGTEKFAFLLRRLEGVSVFLVGNGEWEKARGAELAGMRHVHDYSGRLSIGDMLALIADSQVFVGADSGPLHVASLTRTPIVALYGPNIPAVSGPWRRENVTVIQRDLECRPCSQRTCIHDKMACMDGIDADYVYQAISRYIR
jgi:ADP-heptose:LPS heptosyltransferase